MGRVGAVAIAGLTLLWGCSAAPPSPAGGAPAALAAAPVADAPDAVPTFYRLLAPGPNADLVRWPETLAEAEGDATVVVEAEVSGVRVGRGVGDVGTVVVSLDVLDVVGGAQPTSLGGAVDVEFVGPVGDASELVRTLDRVQPEQPALWFLRWQGEPPDIVKPGAPLRDPTADPSLYRVVHPNAGVFVETSGGVRSAVAQESSAGAPPSAHDEAERLPDLDALIAMVRT